MDKEIMAEPYNGILLRNRKEGMLMLPHRVAGRQKKSILCDSIYIKFGNRQN